MRISTWGAALLCATALLRVVVGCGSDDDGGAAAPADGGVGPDGAPLGPPGTPGTTPPGHADPIPRDQIEQALLGAFCTPMPDCCAAAGIEYVAGGCASLIAGAGAKDAGAYSFIPPTDEGTTYDPQAAGDCVAYYKAVIAEYNELCKKQPVPTIQPGQTEADFILAQSTSELLDPSSVTLQQQSQGCYKMFTGTLAPGATCNGQWQCALPASSVPFGAVAFCSPPNKEHDAGVCQTFAFAKEGESCNGENGATDLRLCFDQGADVSNPKAYLEAASSLYCDKDSHTCTRRTSVADGQTCDREKNRCPDHSYCRSSDDTCQPLLAAGGACNNDENCLSGYCDDTGHCVDRKAPESACTDDEQCNTTRCSKTTNTCKPFSTILATPLTCSGKTP